MITEIKNHRSIRKFSNKAIPQNIMTTILEAATRASTCGNMQSYSMIVTQSPDKLKAISPLHFGQVESMNAQCVVTICADVHRFSKWCEQRDAKPQYDNLIWYVNGVIDGIMAAQNLTLEAESQGLGICVLGTTLYTADKMVELFDLPAGVIPVTAIAMGFPDEQPSLTDRLPLEGVVHYESYNNYTSQEIDDLWCEKEESELTKALLEENNLPNLAQIFTLNRYKGEDNQLFSAKYLELLKSQGFFNQ